MDPRTERFLIELLWWFDVLTTVPTRRWSECQGFCHPRDLAQRLAQLEQGEFVESTRSSNLDRIYRLTEPGRLAAFGGRDHMALWNETWDQCLRILFYDVPVPERALRLRLQRRFKQLRYGRIQKSAWVSPRPLLPLQEALRGIEADPAAFCTICGRPESGETALQIVQRAWDFAAIARAYDQYLDHIRRANRPADIRKDLGWREREHRLWRRAEKPDPLLPRVLWPKGYRGELAFQARAEMLAEYSRNL